MGLLESAHQLDLGQSDGSLVEDADLIGFLLSHFDRIDLIYHLEQNGGHPNHPTLTQGLHHSGRPAAGVGGEMQSTRLGEHECGATPDARTGREVGNFPDQDAVPNRPAIP